MENKKSLSAIIVILSLGIILSSIWVRYSLQKSGGLQKSISTSTDGNVLDLSQIAKYLNMTEEEVSGIINTEKKSLETTGSFTGKMFPYFIINGKQYFYKNEVDEWLKEASSNRREYDTTQGWIF